MDILILNAAISPSTIVCHYEPTSVDMEWLSVHDVCYMVFHLVVDGIMLTGQDTL